MTTIHKEESFADFYLILQTLRIGCTDNGIKRNFFPLFDILMKYNSTKVAYEVNSMLVSDPIHLDADYTKRFFTAIPQ